MNTKRRPERSKGSKAKKPKFLRRHHHTHRPPGRLHRRGLKFLRHRKKQFQIGVPSGDGVRRGSGGACAERDEEQGSRLERGQVGVLLGGGEGGGSEQLIRRAVPGSNGSR